MIPWIDGVLKGGAIILALFVLFQAWKAIRKGKPDTAYLRILKATMIFSVTLVLSFGVIEIAKQYMDREASIEAMTDVGIQSILGAIFEPRRLPGTDTYEYIGRAPNGYEREVSVNPIFQNFSTYHMVQRLWADPGKPDAFIHANKQSSTNSLLIKFIRQGWGCDVTIGQGSNETTHTANYKSLVVRLRGDAKNLSELENSGFQGIGFRVRVVDGRGNEWSWGSTRVITGKMSVDYNDKDTRGQRLILDSATYKDFFFDITSRAMWAPFLRHGGCAPFQDRNQRFNFIHAVVIEPGFSKLESKKQNEADKSNPYKDERGLYDSPNYNGRPLEGILIVDRLFFVNE
ncbi:MAG: hypothetical protein C4531_13635 [Desulfurivibrio sp.]|nr:MAG: hypothetical protein C4531_13635 [Desulfurivibrio sp.]